MVTRKDLQDHIKKTKAALKPAFDAKNEALRARESALQAHKDALKAHEDAKAALVAFDAGHHTTNGGAQ